MLRHPFELCNRTNPSLAQRCNQRNVSPANQNAVGNRVLQADDLVVRNVPIKQVLGLRRNNQSRSKSAMWCSPENVNEVAGLVPCARLLQMRCLRCMLMLIIASVVMSAMIY